MKLFMGTISLTLLTLLAAQAGDVQARPMIVTTSRQTDVPIFPYYGPPLADKNGDLFFHLGGSLFTDATLMKLSHSSWEPTLYKLPADVQHDKYVFYEFAVSPSGELWILANRGPDLLVAGFDSNGQMTSKSAMDLSLADVDIADVVALDNNVLFCYGVTVGKGPGHSFAALFDGTTGKNIRMLRDVFTSVKPGVKEPVWVHSGIASIGDDGNIYLLHESEVVAISPAGEIVKRIKFVKPIQGLIPIIVRASSGYVAIWLHSPLKDGQSKNSYLVLDLSSGKTLGWYLPPTEIKAPAMTFSRTNGFEFLVDKNGKWNLMDAELR